MVHRRRFLKIYSLRFCDIWQNCSFYYILTNENFKMEVKRTNFVTQLQFRYIDYLKSCLLKFGQISLKW